MLFGILFETKSVRLVPNAVKGPFFFGVTYRIIEVDEHTFKEAVCLVVGINKRSLRRYENAVCAVTE